MYLYQTFKIAFHLIIEINNVRLFPSNHHEKAAKVDSISVSKYNESLHSKADTTTA